MSECISSFAWWNGSSSSSWRPLWPACVHRLVAGSYSTLPPLASRTRTPSSG